MRSDGARNSPAHPLAAGLIVILASIALACLIVEIGIRLLGIGKPQFYLYDSSRGWALRPGAAGWQRDEGTACVRVNRWGYRGPDWQLARPADTLRIAVLGDSFTEAQQVAEDQTFGAVTQHEMTRDRQLFNGTGYSWVRHIEVMNFGVDGYGTAQELLTLRRDVWRFDPSVVILAFFAGNDVRNNSVVLEGDKCRPFYIYRYGRYVLGGPLYDSRWFRFGCFMRFESRHSQLLNAIGAAKSVIRAFFRAQARHRSRSRRIMATGNIPARVTILREPGVNDLIYRPPLNQVWRDAWNVTDAEIEMIDRDVRAHHARFLLVSLPTGIQDLPNARARGAYLESIGGASLFYPEEHLQALAATNGFECLSLAPPMQAVADRCGVFFHGFPNTEMGAGHWNWRGHALAGDLIARRLITLLAGARAEQRLPPPEPPCIPRPATSNVRSIRAGRPP